MTFPPPRTLCTAGFTAALVALAPTLRSESRQDWYWDSPVNLHIDNHSRLEGKGHTPEELAAMIHDIPVDMVQVSAYGNQGMTITYQSDRLSDLEQEGQGDWDTLAAWREAARLCNKRFHVYINTRGMKVHTRHPEFMQQDAKGQGHGRGAGMYDACPRPAPDGNGYLEKFLLPLLEEIVGKYRPGGIWTDGDHARTPTCYCKNCAEAWRQLTGQPKPPTDPSDPNWPRWLTLEQERYDAYRRLMAETVHRANPDALYTSNHSWRKTHGERFEKIDPRNAPEGIDTYSADLSHGLMLRETRLSAMLLSPEEEIPYDIMNLINNDGTASLGRVLQQGAVTFASGGSWLLWVRGGSITEKATQDRARLCAQFTHDRRVALGRSISRNPIAVLSSETSWREERVGGRQGYHDFLAANHAALSLQEAAFGVDIVNEHILGRRAEAYRVIVIPNQRALTPEILNVLDIFTANGGVALITGSGLLDGETESPEVAHWLGLSRKRRITCDVSFQGLAGQSKINAIYEVEPGRAATIATFSDGRPALLVQEWKGGRVAYFAGDGFPCPDPSGLAAALLAQLGIGPMVSFETEGHPFLVFAMREKAGRGVLHITDLTTKTRGKPIAPDRANIIDEPATIPELTIRIPLINQPKEVSVVPAATTVRTTWKDGVLSATLGNFRAHAALLLDSGLNDTALLLPHDTPHPARFAWAAAAAFFDIDDDFEQADHGHAIDPLAAYTLRTDAKTRIAITTETAASGRASVKFTDHPDASQPFMPYMICMPQRLDGGTGFLSADLRLEKDAEVLVECRTVENRRAFPVGPAIHFRGNGSFGPQGKPSLGSFPIGQWFRVEITFPLGSGTFDLALHPQGQSPLVHRGLPCVSGTEFRKCAWIGFTSNARAKTSFYLDNLKIERREPR